MEETTQEQKEVTQETEKQESADEQPQPSLEVLQQELDKGRSEIKRLQGLLKAEQKRGVPKEALDSLHEKIDGWVDWTATAFDDIRAVVSGDGEVTPNRKSYREQVAESRQAKSKPEPRNEADPDAVKFINYMISQGLDLEDPLVKEAVGEDRDPSDALAYLKEKIKEQSLAEIDKRAEVKAKTMFEQMLKDSGLTVSGASAPSAPIKDLRSMSPDQKLQEGFKQLAKKK